MTDQEYTTAIIAVTNANPANIEEAKAVLAQMTAIQKECDRRCLEAVAGNRSSRSTHSRKYVAAINAAIEKMSAFGAVRNRRGYYLEVK